ncbi:MBL fold metallo-hydrolase [Mucilaginibacter sp. UR6-11]|uniref:MBL fold metallo-hydrolase n=1 Tax=Mucilaginibacter sp. UR6-11 TaxID=1435644 RepID=UPI001E3E1685|nr:MBL fold metallo-hydrolase [Mucilaginibacter sp. UR6-11]MCC8424666.1 MBL fold metallo-hydrolase [Mucilaginibacter sp. UR6-11]
MSLFVASLNSGSNGNCYYIGNEQEAVLIDAGISCRETETRMARLGLSMRKVKAIFISHEHSDHIRGVTVLAKKYQLPVYITPLTLQYGGLRLDDLVAEFMAEQTISIGGLLITAFAKIHDAAHPHSFTVACGDIKVGVFTDLGAVCENLIQHFQQCHAAFLEANYDEEMLDSGSYPYHLKRRIRGGMGHLSNKQALALFIDYKPAYMSHLFLSHLSKDNNDPALVHNLFNTHARGAEVIVASRYHETAVYHISGASAPAYAPLAGLQTTLF